jgi:hypothetical protein
MALLILAKYEQTCKFFWQIYNILNKQVTHNPHSLFDHRAPQGSTRSIEAVQQNLAHSGSGLLFIDPDALGPDTKDKLQSDHEGSNDADGSGDDDKDSNAPKAPDRHGSA